MRTVLFLCTGNYYRSRFAEEVFNHRAPFFGLNWYAKSRRLALERGNDNVGPISPLTLKALKERNVLARAADRFPITCSHPDLESADLVVALSRAEHRPLMLDHFPDWECSTEFWEVEDVLLALPNIALALIDDQVNDLIIRLSASHNSESTTYASG